MINPRCSFGATRGLLVKTRMLEVGEERHAVSLTVSPTVPVKHIGAVKELVGGYGEGVYEGCLLTVDNEVVGAVPVSVGNTHVLTKASSQ